MPSTGERESVSTFYVHAHGLALPAASGTPGFSASTYVVRGLHEYRDPAAPKEIFHSRKANRRNRAAIIMGIVGAVECADIPDNASIVCHCSDEEIVNSYKEDFLRRDGTPMPDEPEWARLLKSRDRRHLTLRLVFVRKNPVIRKLHATLKRAIVKRIERADQREMLRQAGGTPRKSRKGFPDVPGGYEELPCAIHRKKLPATPPRKPSKGTK
jgi:hypothetical protein